MIGQYLRLWYARLAYPESKRIAIGEGESVSRNGVWRSGVDRHSHDIQPSGNVIIDRERCHTREREEQAIAIDRRAIGRTYRPIRWRIHRAACSSPGI